MDQILSATVTNLNNASSQGIEVHGLLAWIIIAGAVAVALTAISVLISKLFKKFIFPIIKMGIRFEESWPVLEQIATDFKGNGHGTLQDQLQDNSEAIRDVKTDVATLSTYSHNARHELLNKLTTTDLGLSVTKQVADSLRETVEELKKTRQEIAETKNLL